MEIMILLNDSYMLLSIILVFAICLSSGSFYGSMQILPCRSLQGELEAICIGLTSREKSRNSRSPQRQRGGKCRDTWSIVLGGLIRHTTRSDTDSPGEKVCVVTLEIIA